MNEKFYIYFSEMKLHVLFTSQIFQIFVWKIVYFENFRRKNEEKSYQIENYFQK